MQKLKRRSWGGSGAARQGGFLNLPNDNMIKTLGVAVLLCLVCSVVVSTAATVLKPMQVANSLLDKKKNILAVAGIYGDADVDTLFQQIETRVVDMETGNYTEAVDPISYDQRKAANDPQYRVELSKEQDVAQIGARAKYANVYLVRDGEQVSKYILPVKGYGLWSTLYGFVALEADANTVAGITFYEHKETPGLGGEIENPRWQAIWDGKKLLDQQGELALQVIKGAVDSNTPQAQHKIDGLAGATLTSNGVSNMVQFWMGENGFGPYLQRVRSGQMAANGAAEAYTAQAQTRG
ncbi:MAG: Na(+)-translocating NADH-quinone reductase subunit C [Gammaproteobacteria bacterium]|nr:Na(+)-translocating NADH-quinone reductase subunit C [Gammaproteobacteria bacterium]